jgi:hypothetical protein
VSAPSVCWRELPEGNQRAAVHWLAVITVRMVVTAETLGGPTDQGSGE